MSHWQLRDCKTQVPEKSSKRAINFFLVPLSTITSATLFDSIGSFEDSGLRGSKVSAVFPSPPQSRLRCTPRSGQSVYICISTPLESKAANLRTTESTFLQFRRGMQRARSADHFAACWIAVGSSSKIHSTTQIGRLPFLIRSSWNWPSRKFSPCLSL